MPKGIKGWAIFLAAQTVLTFVWRLFIKLADNAMLTWSDDQIAAILGFSAPQASVVISWAIPAFLGAITLLVYHVAQQRIIQERLERAASTERSADTVHSIPTIQTGMGGDYDLREPSQCGGILHTIRVKIINDSESMLIGAKLSIINLNPVSANHRNLPLPQSINLPPGESTYVRVASHSECIEADKTLMCLQTSYPGGFAAPAGFGILTGEHRLQLRLSRDEERLAEIYCRLYVDDHNVLRLERLDKCQTL